MVGASARAAVHSLLRAGYSAWAVDLFGDRDLKRWWDVLLRGILRNQTDVVSGRLWFAQVDAFTGRRDSRTQSELAAFFGGLLAESGDVPRGRAYFHPTPAGVRLAQANHRRQHPAVPRGNPRGARGAAHQT